jgi:1-acyl-sn-glycerol-3-phosphate acyltransferase
VKLRIFTGFSYLPFMIRILRVLYRLMVFPAATFVIVLVATFFKVFRLGPKHLSNIIRTWARLMRWLMRVEMEVSGNIPSVPAVIVSNHRSYLDVIMIPCSTTFAFVAKSSVQKWPIIGWGATMVSTIFVNREDPDSRRTTREQILQRLKENKSVIIFPEGTTHRGPDVLPFKPGMFYAAAQGDIPVIPVALEYQKPGMAWVGDDTFLGHFFREFHTRTIRIKVRFGEPLTDTDGEALNNTCHTWISEQALRMREEWDELRDAKS